MNEEAPQKEAKVGERKEKAAAPPQEASVATRASCLTFVFLLVAALTTWLYLFFFNPDSISFFTAQGWPRIIMVLLLIIIIPIVVFRTVTLWMMRESSKYPDINFAWRAGVEALRENGMSLRSAPIFLILGTGSGQIRRNFMHAAGYEFRINNVPEGQAPLHWYAGPDAIYIVLNDVSWLHAACLPSKRRGGRPLPTDQPRPANSRGALRGTLMADDQQAALGQEASDEQAAQGVGAPARPEVDPAWLRGTMMPSSPAGPSAPSSARPISRRVRRITSQTSTQLLRRLQHVCTLIREARHPVCPINGILALIPFELLQGDEHDVEELERAISADLAVAQRELQLRCPVTAVVTGMDRERGFRELIRRVGAQRAARQRFGQRFDLRATATVKELERFTAHVCGTFEDWVYTQFGEKDALTRPGNSLLFAMLCRVRRSVRTRLSDVLGAGFGFDPDARDAMPIIFSGCYFVATGPKGDRQAFVRGLFDKLKDEQEEIEWTESALNDDRRSRRLSQIGWCISAALLLAIVGLFIYAKLTVTGR